MRKILIGLFIFSTSICIAGKDKPQYAVNKIEKKVYANENSVIRNHSTTVNLTETSAIIHETKVVTLLNKKDFDQYEDWVVGYGNKENVSEFSLTLFDADGKEVNQIKPKDVQDLAAYDTGLYSDYRLKYVHIDAVDYPFTIEFSYKKKVRDTYLFLPRWEPSERPDSYVEKSSLLIDKPSSIDFSVDYRLHGIKLEKNEVTSEKIYFSVENIPSIDWEDFGPQKRYQKPHVILSPHHFDIEGYTGSFEDWQSLGDFYYRINADRYKVKEEFVDPIKDEVNAATSQAEKVKLVYNYLQEKTRYVSVQLGIGGWQSYPAEYVEKNSYGDCKALTTYTKSLLSYFDIEAHHVLIQATDDGLNNGYELNEDIAYNAFNHVILAVPEQQDTIWLECTSQTKPFNYLGSFTMNNKGLVVKPNGESHLVNTPKTSSDKDNSTNRIEVWLDENGSAKIDYKYNAKGILAERLYGAYNGLSNEDFEKYLSDIIGLPNSKLQDFEFKQGGKVAMEVELEATFLTSNVANKTGSRFFLKPLNFQQEIKLPKDVEDRIHDFILTTSFKENMEIIYHLPEGYNFETAETDSVNLSVDMGRYIVDYKIEDNILNVFSTYEVKQGAYPPSTAKEYLEFASAINDVSKRMAVLKNNGDNDN